MNWYKKSQQNKVVTFDFDSTLTIPEYEDGLWMESMRPNWRNINLLKILAKKGYEIHIVTSRDIKYETSTSGSYGSNGFGLYDFLNVCNLMPFIKDVHFTGSSDNGNKYKKLKELGSIRHYDDLKYDIEDANRAGAKGIKVPHAGEEGGNLPPEQNKIYQKSIKRKKRFF